MDNKYTTADITQPKDGYIIFMNHFWVCVNGDPTKAVFTSDCIPLCLKTEFMLEKLVLPYTISGGTIKRIPVAYAKPSNRILAVNDMFEAIIETQRLFSVIQFDDPYGVRKRINYVIKKVTE